MHYYSYIHVYTFPFTDTLIYYYCDVLICFLERCRCLELVDILLRPLCIVVSGNDHTSACSCTATIQERCEVSQSSFVTHHQFVVYVSSIQHLNFSVLNCFPTTSVSRAILCW